MIFCLGICRGFDKFRKRGSKKIQTIICLTPFGHGGPAAPRNPRARRAARGAAARPPARQPRARPRASQPARQPARQAACQPAPKNQPRRRHQESPAKPIEKHVRPEKSPTRPPRGNRPAIPPRKITHTPASKESHAHRSHQRDYTSLRPTTLR